MCMGRVSFGWASVGGGGVQGYGHWVEGLNGAGQVQDEALI